MERTRDIKSINDCTGIQGNIKKSPITINFDEIDNLVDKTDQFTIEYKVDKFNNRYVLITFLKEGKKRVYAITEYHPLVSLIRGFNITNCDGSYLPKTFKWTKSTLTTFIGVTSEKVFAFLENKSLSIEDSAVTICRTFDEYKWEF